VQPETRYARAGDGYIGYQVIGDGTLDLVFIPSWSSTSTSCGSTRRSRVSCAASARLPA